MIFWIASYPKSGNTWVRAFLTNYLTKNKLGIFQDIENITRFPRKDQFEGLVNESEFNKGNLDMFKYFILAQEKINNNNKLNILKTHNFAGSIQNSPFSDLKNTSAALYLVRDPRSVAVSYAYHANISFEKSVDDLLHEKRIIDNSGVSEARLSWKINLMSWLNSPWPKLLIRYEDLHNDAFGYFKRILIYLSQFVKIEIDDEKIKQSIKTCSFKNLSDLEKKIGFKERKNETNFFRKGEIDEWKNSLPSDLIKKIETHFKKEMEELGYI